MKKLVCLCAAVLALAAAAWAQEVSLPSPSTSGGAPLLDCLSARRSSRVFADVDLTAQELSDLLWATGGVNAPDGRLTYPTAMDVRDLTIAVLTRDGAYLYDPEKNVLVLVAAGDHRAAAKGMQASVANAAVCLAYVLTPRAGKKPVPVEMSYIHAGSAAQNASLFAAAKGWASVVRGSFDGVRLAALLGLDAGQKVLLVHSIGPKPQM